MAITVCNMWYAPYHIYPKHFRKTWIIFTLAKFYASVKENGKGLGARVTAMHVLMYSTLSTPLCRCLWDCSRIKWARDLKYYSIIVVKCYKHVTTLTSPCQNFHTKRRVFSMTFLPQDIICSIPWPFSQHTSSSAPFHDLSPRTHHHLLHSHCLTHSLFKLPENGFWWNIFASSLIPLSTQYLR